MHLASRKFGVYIRIQLCSYTCTYRYRYILTCICMCSVVGRACTTPVCVGTWRSSSIYRNVSTVAKSCWCCQTMWVDPHVHIQIIIVFITLQNQSAPVHIHTYIHTDTHTCSDPPKSSHQRWHTLFLSVIKKIISLSRLPCFYVHVLSWYCCCHILGYNTCHVYVCVYRVPYIYAIHTWQSLYVLLSVLIPLSHAIRIALTVLTSYFHLQSSKTKRPYQRPSYKPVIILPHTNLLSCSS
jgi:hypothetical protein